jgi:hypothetical protein
MSAFRTPPPHLSLAANTPSSLATAHQRENARQCFHACVNICSQHMHSGGDMLSPHRIARPTSSHTVRFFITHQLCSFTPPPILHTHTHTHTHMEAHTHVPTMANWRRTSHLMQRQRVLTDLARAVLASAPHRTACQVCRLCPIFPDERPCPPSSGRRYVAPMPAECCGDVCPSCASPARKRLHSRASHSSSPWPPLVLSPPRCVYSCASLSTRGWAELLVVHAWSH